MCLYFSTNQGEIMQAQTQEIGNPLLQYPHVIEKGNVPNSRFFTNIILAQLPHDTSIQQVWDNVYIFRAYNKGENHPKPHIWSCTITIENGLYHCYGLTATGENVLKPNQMRQMHKFFMSMGLKKDYISGNQLQKEK
jgi:hypothetical protein